MCENRARVRVRVLRERVRVVDVVPTNVIRRCAADMTYVQNLYAFTVYCLR